MYEIINHLGKVQDTRKTRKEEQKVTRQACANIAWEKVNPDRINLVHVFGGAFRVRIQKAS